MQHLGLNHADLRLYHAALRSSHPIRVRVALCDLEEKPVASIVPRVLSGQITVDTTADVTRMLSMELLDPRNQLDLDPNSRSDGSLFLDRIVKVYYSVWVDDLDQWVTAQPFTGVPWKLSRTGAVVTIEAHGKERLLLRPAWNPFSRAAGSKKVNVLEQFLRLRGGEARFDFPKLDTRLPHPFTVARHQIMWKRAKRLTASMDHKQLFYPGTGRCTLRHLPGHPAVTFRRGEGGSLVDEVQIDTEVGDFANSAYVQGRRGLDPGIATLKPYNPLSPSHLARNGVPGVIGVFDHNDHIRTETAAERRAVRLLDHQDQATVSRSYGVLPYPHLDELDLVAVELPDGSTIQHRMTQWALPLATEGSPAMPVGYTRRLTAAKRQIRKR
jgi:hypothetical protein